MGGKSDVGALEIRRGDTDCSERGAVQADGRANHFRPAPETVAPEVVLEHGDGMGVALLVVLGRKEAAGVWPDSQDAEIVPGYERDADHLAAFFADEARLLDELAGETGKYRVSIPECEVGGMREGVLPVPAV